MSVVMKCDFNGDLRRLALSEGATFAELQRLLGQVYNIDATEFKIRYVDDENDLITVTSDPELVEAVKLAKEAQQPLRLVLAAAPAASSADSKGDCKRGAVWREAWLARKAAFKAARAERRKRCGHRAAASEEDKASDKDKSASESESESDREACRRRRWRKLFKHMMMRRLMGHHIHPGPHSFGGFGFGPARPPCPPFAKRMWHPPAHGARRHFGVMGRFRRLHHRGGLFCGRFGLGRHGFAHGLKPECPRSPSPVGRPGYRHKVRPFRRMLRRRLFKRMMLLAALKKHKRGCFGVRGCHRVGHRFGMGMGMRPHGWDFRRWGRMFA